MFVHFFFVVYLY